MSPCPGSPHCAGFVAIEWTDTAAGPLQVYAHLTADELRRHLENLEGMMAAYGSMSAGRISRFRAWLRRRAAAAGEPTENVTTDTPW